MLLFKRKDKKLTKQNSRSDSVEKIVATKPILGVPLKTAVSNSKCYDGIPVPALVRNCIDYVEENGLDVEGIYRVSAFISRLDEMERLANSGGFITIADPHDAAGILKRFLRQLPDHMFQFQPYAPSRFEAVAETCKCPFENPCKCQVVPKLKEMLEEAPKENYFLMAYVFIHAHHVIERQKDNKMTLGALGVLLQAMLSVSKNIIRIFILNAIPSSKAEPSDSTVYLFDKVPFKRYIPPLTSEQIISNPPETLAEVETEIFKQQNLLEEINDQVLELRKQNIDTKQREHDMWECQHSITFLKRRLKTFTRDIKIDGDDETSASTSTIFSSICESGPTLEKQLLAVQNSLIEEIAEEQRQIAELTNRLHELQQDISLNLISHQKTPLLSYSNQNNARPKIAPPPPPPQPPIFDLAIVNGIQSDGILEENDPSCDECHRQEARKNALLTNISKVRDECAQFRSKLEDSREIAIDAADDFGNSNVLVTKF